MDRFDLLYFDQLEPIKECYFNKQDKLASRYKSPMWHLYIYICLYIHIYIYV